MVDGSRTIKFELAQDLLVEITFRVCEVSEPTLSASGLRSVLGSRAFTTNLTNKFLNIDGQKIKLHRRQDEHHLPVRRVVPRHTIPDYVRQVCQQGDDDVIKNMKCEINDHYKSIIKLWETQLLSDKVSTMIECEREIEDHESSINDLVTEINASRKH